MWSLCHLVECFWGGLCFKNLTSRPFEFNWQPHHVCHILREEPNAPVPMNQRIPRQLFCIREGKWAFGSKWFSLCLDIVFPLPDSDFLTVFYSFRCHDFGRFFLQCTIHSLLPTPTWEHTVFTGVLYLGETKTQLKVRSKFAGRPSTARFQVTSHVIWIWSIDR